MPSRPSARGNAPTTSARPPVLTSGKISEATDSTRRPLIATPRSSIQPVDHRLGHEADASRRAPEPPRVKLGVLADDELSRYADAAIDDDVAQACAPADLDLGQHDRAFEDGIRMDPHAREEKRAAHRRAGDDATARHERRETDAAATVRVMDEFRGRRD